MYILRNSIGIDPIKPFSFISWVRTEEQVGKYIQFPRPRPKKPSMDLDIKNIKLVIFTFILVLDEMQ